MRFSYFSNILKALPEMGLHGRRVFGLRQNLKQLIIGQEVESWEGVTLGLEVLAESLLHLLKQLVTLTQVVKETLVWTQRDDLDFKDNGKEFINFLKSLKNSKYLFLSLMKTIDVIYSCTVRGTMRWPRFK